MSRDELIVVRAGRRLGRAALAPAARAAGRGPRRAWGDDPMSGLWLAIAVARARAPGLLRRGPAGQRVGRRRHAAPAFAPVLLRDQRLHLRPPCPRCSSLLRLAAGAAVGRRPHGREQPLAGAAARMRPPRSLAMSDVRRVAEGLDIAVARGAMTEDDGARHSACSRRMSARRLAEVGVALGSAVDPSVLNAAKQYRADRRDRPAG